MTTGKQSQDRKQCGCLALLIVCISASLSGQEIRTISGTIVDAASGEPIPLANVVIRDSRIGTTTDTLGSYTLSFSVSDSFVISVSHIGYEKMTLGISWGDTDSGWVNVRLHPATVRLPEVVITGTTFREKRTIAMLDASDFEQAGETRLDRALEYLLPFRFFRLEDRMRNPDIDFTLYIDDVWYESMYLDDVHPFNVRRMAIWRGGMAPVGYPLRRGKIIVAIWTILGNWKP